MRDKAAAEMMSKLRVVKGTLIGVRVCLADAMEFTKRATQRFEEARSALVEAMANAGIETPAGRTHERPAHARAQKKKAPAKTKKAGAPRRRRG